MKKSHMIVIGIVCIFLVVIGIVYYTQFSSEGNNIQIGKTSFSMPDGFHKGQPNGDGDTNITNGKISVFINHYNDNDLNKHVKDYCKYKKSENLSTNISNFTVEHIHVSKVNIATDNYTVHYWFSNNREVYSIYTWDGNIDNIVSDLIKSMH